MNKLKIISIGTAFPPHSYTQEQVWEDIGYKNLHFKRLFMDAKILKRHFWVSFPQAMKMSWQELQEEYMKGAAELSKQSVRDCLDGIDPHTLGSVTYVSCTGYQCPSVAHHIAGDLCLSPDVYYTNVLGMGCGGGFPGLKRAYDHTKVTGRPSLVIATEVCSSCFYPEGGSPDPEDDYEVMRANAIFGDASAAVLVGYDDNPRHPHILDFESNCDPEYLHDLGFEWRGGRWRVILSKRVKDVAPLVVKPAVDRLLSRHMLSISDIQWFIVHAAGSTVLDNMRDVIGIPEEKLNLSREVLLNYGNCSSTTIGLVGKRMMEGEVDPWDRVLVVSVGPGMEGGATLLQFGGE